MKRPLFSRSGLFALLCILALIVPHAIVAAPQLDDAAIVQQITELQLAPPAYSDHFRQADGMWGVDESDETAIFYSAGTLQINLKTAQWTAWTSATITATNFYAEADSFHVRGPLNNQLGLVFRLVDNDNFYYYTISHAGYFRLDKKVAGAWVTLLDWAESTAIVSGEGAANLLGVLAEGDQLTLLANGTVLTTYQDDSYAQGAIGVAAGAFDEADVLVAFDDLHVWGVGDAPVAIGTPEAEPTTTPIAVEDLLATVHDQEPVFSDEFRQDDGGWRTATDENAQISYLKRALHIQVNAEKQLGWSFNQQLEELALSDFLAEAEVEFIDSDTNRAADGEAGLLFRYVDEQSYYLFALGKQGTYALWKRTEGKWTKLVDWTESKAIDITAGTDTGIVNRLGVLAQGSQFTLLINDQVVETVADEDFAYGSIGLAVGSFAEAGVEAAFDNVDVWSIEEAAIASAETATPQAPAAVATPAPDTLERVQLLAAGDPSFSDRFSRNDGQWTVNSDDKVEISYNRSTLRIHVLPKAEMQWSTGAVTVTNFLLELDAQVVSAPNDADYGIAFRQVDEGNFYYFAVSPYENGSYSLWKAVDSKWQPLIPWTVSAAVHNADENHLALLAEGTTITVLVNDTPLATVEDDAFASGSLALSVGTHEAGDAEIAFDAINVWELPVE